MFLFRLEEPESTFDPSETGCSDPDRVNVRSVSDLQPSSIRSHYAFATPGKSFKVRSHYAFTAHGKSFKVRSHYAFTTHGKSFKVRSHYAFAAPGKSFKVRSHY